MSETLGAALEREHREIDGGIEAFIGSLPDGRGTTEPLLRSISGLRRHIYLEEEFLFPPLREAGMMVPLFVMLRQHGELWQSMDALTTLLTTDSDAEALRASCASLLDLLDQHNSKEEPIIYPQADKVLTADASAELSEFLEAGTMPEDWTCAKA
ncbi:hemerythrin domain-containing protein [Parafrigoribacterium soli]|uniref:hemerythrin domain-containing protein n=1 Tax=Parafrigoribacterium soli TaxID=3144663 RepID=UPI0032EF5DFB